MHWFLASNLFALTIIDAARSVGAWQVLLGKYQEVLVFLYWLEHPTSFYCCWGTWQVMQRAGERVPALGSPSAPTNKAQYLRDFARVKGLPQLPPRCLRTWS